MQLLEDYKIWKEENPDEGYQYDMIHEFLADYNRGQLQSFLEDTLKCKKKADKWDKLDERIGKFYETEDTEGDICEIGLICASELGYL